MKRSNDIKKKKNSESEKTNSSNEEDFKMNKPFAIIDDLVFSSKISSSKISSTKTSSSKLFLRRSWISDHAAITHVCNKIMTLRFIKNRDEDNWTITVENCEWSIKSYDHIKIKRQKEFEVKEITLLNVCYIFEFMTKLISRHILFKKDVHFMTETERLYRYEKTFDRAKKKNDQFYIENNDDNDEKKSFESFESENEIFDQKDENQEFFQEENQIVFYQKEQNSSVSYSTYYSQISFDVKWKTTQNWHQILAHAGNEIIQNLEKSIQKIKISDDKKTSKTNECETYALSKAHKIIFRFNQKFEFSKEKLFHRVTYDFM